jgi:hypothetical protein
MSTGKGLHFIDSYSLIWIPKMSRTMQVVKEGHNLEATSMRFYHGLIEVE